jgi:hypothetical protein
MPAILTLCGCGLGVREACAVCLSHDPWAYLYVLSELEVACWLGQHGDIGPHCNPVLVGAGNTPQDGPYITVATPRRYGHTTLYHRPEERCSSRPTARGSARWRWREKR